VPCTNMHIRGVLALAKREMRKRFPVIEKRIGTETVFAGFLGSSLETAGRRLVAHGNGSALHDVSFSRLFYERRYAETIC